MFVRLKKSSGEYGMWLNVSRIERITDHTDPGGIHQPTMTRIYLVGHWDFICTWESPEQFVRRLR